MLAVKNLGKSFITQNDFLFSDENDIVLLRLKTPSKCGKNIHGACISTHEPKNKEKVTVSGWGYTKYNGKMSNILRKLHIKIIGRNICSQWLPITENMICAGIKKGGKDACQGDSGGTVLLY